MADTIGQAFDDSVAYYDDWMRMALPNFTELFSVAVGLIPFAQDDPISVLDLGAGTGLFSWHVLEKYPTAHFTLCDLAPKMLELAQRRFQPYNGQFACRIEDYRYLVSDQAFDLVISSLSIHHLADPDKAALFQRIYSFLKPSGLFINIDQIKGPSEYWQTFYWNQWLERVRRSGAAEEEIEASIQRRKAYDQEASLPDQLLWLNRAGFAQVDCVYKHTFIGVFCAIK
ncbi:MAG: class I SAM-dependent methyltransferase [Chloroflexota bacterium]